MTVEEYMKKFYVKEKRGTLYDILKKETVNFDKSATDTDRALCKKKEILEDYYYAIKNDDKFNEEEYNKIMETISGFVKDALSQQ